MGLDLCQFQTYLLASPQSHVSDVCVEVWGGGVVLVVDGCGSKVTYIGQRSNVEVKGQTFFFNNNKKKMISKKNSQKKFDEKNKRKILTKKTKKCFLRNENLDEKNI